MNACFGRSPAVRQSYFERAPSAFLRRTPSVRSWTALEPKRAFHKVVLLRSPQLRALTLNPCGRLPGPRTRRLSQQTHFPKNDETAFRLQARGLEGTVPASLRVELDTGGSAFRPVSQPIKSGHGRSAALKRVPAALQPVGASRLDALIRQARKNLRYGRGSGRPGRRREARGCRAAGRLALAFVPLDAPSGSASAGISCQPLMP